MAIYTKTGDYGKTSLYQGQRVSKANLALDASGTIDELNSFIGLAVSEIKQNDIKNFLKKIQIDLFTIGSKLSGYPKDIGNLDLSVVNMEKIIDRLEKKLPPLSSFVLPTGKSSTYLHVARAVTRRAERIVVSFLSSKTDIGLTPEKKQQITKYLNRLSDLLFMLARFANQKENIKEEIWQSQ